MEIRAATLAGGTQNQDAYIVGENFAGVFDGASNHLHSQEDAQGTAWYVQTLARAVKDALPAAETLASAVHTAIAVTAGRFKGDPATCPTSTVALARWSHETVYTYVLGDSYIASLRQDSSAAIVTDSRMADVGACLRRNYRMRLQFGKGFDDKHADLLKRLQVAQAAVRNQPGGYWIAGAEPEAAKMGITDATPRPGLRGVIIATDGGATPQSYGLVESWFDFLEKDLAHLLGQAAELERADSSGRRWPRSKRSDDKTIVVVNF